jgi:hypothetical protein
LLADDDVWEVVINGPEGTFAESRVSVSRGVEVPNAPDAPEERDDNDAVDEPLGLPSSPPPGARPHKVIGRQTRPLSVATRARVRRLSGGWPYPIRPGPPLRQAVRGHVPIRLSLVNTMGTQLRISCRERHIATSNEACAKGNESDIIELCTTTL